MFVLKDHKILFLFQILEIVFLLIKLIMLLNIDTMSNDVAIGIYDLLSLCFYKSTETREKTIV